MMSKVTTLLIASMLISSAAVAEGFPAVRTNGSRATATVSITIPPLTAVRVAQGSGPSTITLSLFRTTDVVVVRRADHRDPSPYQLVSLEDRAKALSAEMPAGGWTTIDDDVSSSISRASSRGESDTEVTYEIWSF